MDFPYFSLKPTCIVNNNMHANMFIMYCVYHSFDYFVFISILGHWYFVISILKITLFVSEYENLKRKKINQNKIFEGIAF